LNAANGRGRVQLQPRVMSALMAYQWPGNVRELGNLIERLSILCPTGRVDLGDLPARYRPQGWSSGDDMQEIINSLQSQTASEQSATQIEIVDGNTEDEGLLPDEQALLVMGGDGPSDGSLAELPNRGLDLRSHLYDIERALIRQAMERAGGTVAHAARLLQLRRTTLVEKLRKFELLDERMASEV
jgi:sigma-54 specific flagellar transcriptional regulator A